MNRSPRRSTRFSRRDECEVREVLPPKVTKRYDISPPMLNRCCNVSPEMKDEGLCTESVALDQYQNLLLEQYGFDPTIRDAAEDKKLLLKQCGFDFITTDISHHSGRKNNFFERTLKVDNGYQYARPLKNQCVSYEDIGWQNVENAEDIDKILNVGNDETAILQEIEICDIPTVKVVAEKYSKFKKNDVEVRKMEEKIVCLEYDVLAEYGKGKKPFQKLRAYFSVRPQVDAQGDVIKPTLTSSVRLKFNIAEKDMNTLNDKEIEMIDGKISENRLYLDDLRRILKRQQNIYERKNKTSLDLMYLYKMAKEEKPAECSNANLLSKAELEEIKNLIKDKCSSDVHGLERRKIKSEKNDLKRDRTIDVVSESIYTEIVRNFKK